MTRGSGRLKEFGGVFILRFAQIYVDYKVLGCFADGSSDPERLCRIRKGFCRFGGVGSKRSLSGAGGDGAERSGAESPPAPDRRSLDPTPENPAKFLEEDAQPFRIRADGGTTAQKR